MMNFFIVSVFLVGIRGISNFKIKLCKADAVSTWSKKNEIANYRRSVYPLNEKCKMQELAVSMFSNNDHHLYVNILPEINSNNNFLILFWTATMELIGN